MTQDEKNRALEAAYKAILNIRNNVYTDFIKEGLTLRDTNQ